MPFEKGNGNGRKRNNRYRIYLRPKQQPFDKNVDGTVTSYSYNELNQLVSETGISYEYDLNGNLVKKTEGSQTTAYTYNAQNRLIRVTVQSGQQVNVVETKFIFQR